MAKKMSEEEAKREAERIFQEAARKAGYRQFSKDPEIDRALNELFQDIGKFIAMALIEGGKEGIKRLARKVKSLGKRTVGDDSVAEEGTLLGKQYLCENCGRDLNELKTLPFQFKNRAVCPECFELLRDQEGEEPIIQ